LGDGKIASFWSDRWLHGTAPKDVAPLCYPLAFRKKITVHQGMLDGRWMSGLNRISSQEQLEQFIKLWNLVQQVSLQEDRRDAIAWTLTPDGKYSARSAYNVQFLGRIKQPHLERVWKVRAEGKVQMFLWFLL
jgi:cell wall assembly regulator SMI1